MIKEGRNLPPLVTDRIPVIIEKVSKDSEVVALFSFESLAKGTLKTTQRPRFRRSCFETH
jgi:hypothetical protein